MIGNWLITSMAAKALWMPNTIHTTQIPSIADLSVAASTNPANHMSLMVIIQLHRLQNHFANAATEASVQHCRTILHSENLGIREIFL